MGNSTVSLAALLQEFVEARIGTAELIRRAEALLPAGSDTTAEILTWLAQSDQMLRLPRGREPLAQRLREFAREEITWEELDLWAFALEHTEPLSPDRFSAAPEEALLREVLAWIEDWQEAEARPGAAKLDQLARILLEERDAARCLERLEAALARR
ncbi:MAG: hypothetical protein HY653_07475 [Acidobacteria bacterium]|nr:hypothetical protein [Acidobacteriota bacterium]